MHVKEENNLKKKVKQTDKSQFGGMFTWKLKMAAVFFVKLYMSLPIHGCIDLSNPLQIDRDTIFFKDISNSRGECTPKGGRGV